MMKRHVAIAVQQIVNDHPARYLTCVRPVSSGDPPELLEFYVEVWQRGKDSTVPGAFIYTPEGLAHWILEHMREERAPRTQQAEETAP